MKKLFTAATLTAILSASVLVGTPLAAQQQEDGESIVVTSQLPMKEWANSISQELSQHLNRSQGASMRDEASGIVQVRFDCDLDGRPTNISLYNRTGHRSLVNRAIRALGKLDTMHPLPQGVRPGQPFLANMVFATSEQQSEQLHDRLAFLEAKRLASARAERTYLAIK